MTIQILNMVDRVQTFASDNSDRNLNNHTARENADMFYVHLYFSFRTTAPSQRRHRGGKDGMVQIVVN